jgi:phosphopantothenoylcysteine decarboxylase/phosphopantothenate--cysteine ligase
MPRVVLGVTGCIGAYKACEILRELQKRDVDVRVVMTENAARFVSPLTLEALSRHPVFLDPFALGPASGIQHVDLADEADLLLVAPATANILGKFARGIADDALSTLYLATRAPVLIAPAMNVNMFSHPAVAENLEILRGRGVRFVEPGTGYLACGWLGKGRLAETDDVVSAAMALLARRQDLRGETVLVTAGPTVEDVDPVRFLSNRSSGRMGYRIAEAARDRGAHVILVSGPTAIGEPEGIPVVRVRSAEEMAGAVAERLAEASIVVMAAAVADYRPAAPASSKIKRSQETRTLDLVPTADILGAVKAVKGERFVVGFAAETEDLRRNARGKLLAKGLDLIVANDVARNDAGFDSERNAAVLMDAAGGEIEVPLVAKRELAERIWDRVIELRELRGAATAPRRGGGSTSEA